jgi:hypothetical protein
VVVSDSPTPAVRGGCLCGAVRFELTVPPVSASYCHCTRCQRRTGTAASAQASIERGSLRIVQGEEHIGAWEPADGWAKLFCRLCGAALFSRHPTDRDVFSVRMGAFDEDPGVRPGYRQYIRSAAVWEPIPDDGLPRYQGPRSAG